MNSFKKMDCLFCKIINNEIPAYKVWEDDNFLAFLDINPIKPGHTLLIPKTHAEDLFEMDNASYGRLLETAKKLIPSLKNVTAAKRIGMAVEGFGVPHAHIHLVPVNFGNELNPALAKSMTASELESMRDLIKGGLSGVN